MKLLSYDDESGWFKCIIDGHWINCRIFEQPGQMGLNKGRIYKLFILKTESQDPRKPFLDQCAYSYDLHEMKNEITPEFLNKVVTTIEEITS